MVAGDSKPVLLPLSAKNDEALRAVAGRMRDFLLTEGANTGAARYRPDRRHP